MQQARQIGKIVLTVGHAEVGGEGSYLISGGLGALGLAAAEWLAEQGAGCIVLLGRQAPAAAVRQRLDELQSRHGCTIHSHAGDVSDGATVARLLERFAGEWPALRGIIHAAGVLDDGLISEQRWERFARVLKPKAVGAWQLHEQTRSLALDFFVVYSSAASVLGSPGQSNDAVANAFLDGLAAERRAEGLAGSSMNWGRWAEGGLAGGALIQGRLARQGMTPLESDQAHRVLEQVLAAGVSAVVLDADWPRMSQYVGEVRAPLLSELLDRPALEGHSLHWIPRSRWDIPSGRCAASSLGELGQIASNLEQEPVRLDVGAIGNGVQTARRIGGEKQPAARDGHQESSLRKVADRFVGAHLQRAFRELGWSPSPGEIWTTEALGERLGIKPNFHRLLGRMLEILAEDGLVCRDRDCWEVTGAPWDEALPGELLRELLERHGDHAAELMLADACGQRLAAVLRGEVDPLSILFPEGSPDQLARIYGDAPVAQAGNRLIAETIAMGVQRMSQDRVVRIIEIGAGTGGTTSHVLSRLPSGRCEYVFTDVSSLFLHHARERFREHGFVQYRPLDIEREPSQSGYAPHQFDIVLAANVLHATSDLKASLANVRQLLAPRGWLILLEGTGRERILDLVFGLTPGWWRYGDLELRPDYPLITREAWLSLLETEGFTGATAAAPIPGSQQVVFLGRAPSTVFDPPSRAGRSLGTWRILTDHPALASGLRQRLEAEGARCAPFDPTGNGSAPSSIPGVGACECGSVPDAPCRCGADLNVVDLRRLAEESMSKPYPGSSFSTREHAPRNGTGTTPVSVATRTCSTATSLTSSELIQSENPAWVVTRGSAVIQQAIPSSGRWVDLDPTVSIESCLDQLVRELIDPDDQPFIAFRDGQRYVAQREKAPARHEVEDGEASSARVLRSLDPADRRQRILDTVCSELARTLNLPIRAIEVDRPMVSFGLDSLMAMQLKNRVETLAGVSISIGKLLEGITVAEFAAEVDEAVAGERNGSDSPDVSGPNGTAADALGSRRNGEDLDSRPIDNSIDDIEDLSERELDLLIGDLLTGTDEHDR
jgi:SAM-dependent methyltransferase